MSRAQQKSAGRPRAPHSLLADPPLQIRAPLPQWRLRKNRRPSGRAAATPARVRAPPSPEPVQGNEAAVVLPAAL